MDIYDTQDEGRGTGVQQECNDPSDIRYHGQLLECDSRHVVESHGPRTK